MTALALSATMMTSSFVVLRSSHAAWTAHEADLAVAGNAAAVLRHFTRNARQSAEVAAISDASETSGAITLVRDNGAPLRWAHSGSAVTLSQDGGAAQPLADDIQELRFEGYLADGVTPTTEASDIQAVRVVVRVTMPVGTPRTISSFVWVRSW